MSFIMRPCGTLMRIEKMADDQIISDQELEKIAIFCFPSDELQSWLRRFPSDTKPEMLKLSGRTVLPHLLKLFINGYRTAKAGLTKYDGMYPSYSYESYFLKGYAIGKNSALIAQELANREVEFRAALKKQHEWDQYVKENNARKIEREQNKIDDYNPYGPGGRYGPYYQKYGHPSGDPIGRFNGG